MRTARGALLGGVRTRPVHRERDRPGAFDPHRPGSAGHGRAAAPLRRVGGAGAGANTALMPTARSVVRIVLIVVCVAIALYLLYLLRRPIAWLLIAIFLAVALSPPVNWLATRMRRGFAIAIVYLCLPAVPLLLVALIVPPLITEADRFAQNVPAYAGDVTDFVEENESLRKINEDYDITGQIEKEAGKLPGRLGGAAGTLRDVGFGIVSSLFA